MIETDWLSKKKFLIGKVFFSKLNASLVRELKIKKNYQVSVSLVGDILIKKLNKRWRKKDKPTDVLSWSFQEGRQIIIKNAPIILGEIVIDYQQAQRQAREYRHSLRSELAKLYIHGLLHLLGFDHNTLSKSKKMKVLEEAILKRAGFKL